MFFVTIIQTFTFNHNNHQRFPNSNGYFKKLVSRGDTINLDIGINGSELDIIAKYKCIEIKNKIRRLPLLFLFSFFNLFFKI